MKISLKEYSKLKDYEKRDAIVVKDIDINADEGESRTASFIITTGTPDTDRDIILPDGIDFTYFNRNPVVLWQHDKDQLPVGKCISVQKIDNGWKATVEFISKDISPFADTVYQMVKSGFLNAVSIGFLPTDLDPNEYGGLTINKCNLFEFSIVTIPANPECLVVDVNKNIKLTKLKKKIQLYKYNNIQI
ncbi:HK97 family phage prohead protease [Acetobacter persici]|uniref:HK97 family phage prohead protease n=1 Tax=Acetobacter persici TaxID=1076596 RepID=UPI001BA4858D|nr:HK97 family phage prohead protease [Acetobacter persici]MBS1016879.1 HK97 family phage prohead protease [Acetobacter persici]MCP9321032.1 HK97 family phage prohead protease [Acetobacter persici]